MWKPDLVLSRGKPGAPDPEKVLLVADLKTDGKNGVTEEPLQKVRKTTEQMAAHTKSFLGEEDRYVCTLGYYRRRRGGERDTGKLKKMEQHRAPLMIKMLHSYHLLLMLFPDMDWQRTVPSSVDGTRHPIVGKQLFEFHKLAEEELDPLQGFISQDPNVFDFGPDLMMSEAAFVEEYMNYRVKRLHKTRAKWVKDHYQIVFENFEIRRDTAQMQDANTGAYKLTAVLKGLAPKEAD